MIFRSPFPEVRVPEVALTPFVLRRADELRDKPALIDGSTGREWTYGQVKEAIYRAAAGLASRGFRKGDVFAIYCHNAPEYAIAFHAAVLLGGVVTTINPLYTAGELRIQLRDSGATYLLTADGALDRALEAAHDSNIREIFAFERAPGVTPFQQLLHSGGTVPEVVINPREDLAALPYSSGTTGLPKGVMLTHYNLVANLLQIEGTAHNRPDDTLICALPFFHIYGMVVILNLGLYQGATIITMPRFDLEHMLKLMQDYRVTFAHLVPPIMLALAKQPVVDHYDLSSLRTIFCAAAPLSRDLLTACASRLGCFVKQGYGMTEASPATHMCADEPERVKTGSVGVPVPNSESKVVDPESGKILGPNQEGEICIRGPQIMLGYLNNQEATAHAIDPEGWLHTGDIGFADEEGHFYIVDRLKELIKYKGFQIAPAELEAVLLTHPGVGDAAVIAVQDDEAGEVPKAFVVLKTKTTPEEISAYVAAHVAPYKKLRQVEIVDQIPKSPSGKILRRVLIDREKGRDSTTKAQRHKGKDE